MLAAPPPGFISCIVLNLACSEECKFFPLDSLFSHFPPLVFFESSEMDSPLVLAHRPHFSMNHNQTIPIDPAHAAQQLGDIVSHMTISRWVLAWASALGPVPNLTASGILFVRLLY